jgi:cytochrome P450
MEGTLLVLIEVVSVANGLFVANARTAGTTATVNMWGIEHDPSVCSEPFAFPPERFKEDVSVLGGDVQLVPFLVRGSGRRMCPGKMLALTTIHLWLAQLLQIEWVLAYDNVDLAAVTFVQIQT